MNRSYPKVILGEKIWSLTPIREEIVPRTRGKGNRKYYHCICDCGNESRVLRDNLVKGHTKTCGCLQRKICSERLITHGKTDTTEYEIWCGMHKRCSNRNNKFWEHYGGRGIRVCERWNEFENFYADMGPRPDGKTLDRIDNNGDYSKENCKWSTWEEQARNKNNNRVISFDGKTQCLTAWAKEKEIEVGTLWSRLGRMSIEESLSTKGKIKWTKRKDWLEYEKQRANPSTSGGGPVGRG